MIKKKTFLELLDSPLGKNINDFLWFKTVDCKCSLNWEQNLQISLLNWYRFLEKTGKRDTVESLGEFKDDLQRLGRNPSWIKKQISIIKNFYEWLYSEGRIPRNPMGHFMNNIRIEAKPQEAYTSEEINTILSNCKTTETRCWVGLQLIAGLRTAEVISLRVEQIDFKNHIISAINNKGTVTHVGVHIRLDPQLFKDLKQHMDEQGIEFGPLFDISESQYSLILRKTILPRGNPHLLRKTAGVLAYKMSNRCLKTTQSFMRHKQLNTTAYYLESMILPREDQPALTVW